MGPAKISEAEVRKALKRMMSGKAVGPDEGMKVSKRSRSREV